MKNLCPLCKNSQSIGLHSYQVDALRSEWMKGNGYDPFPKDLGTEIKKIKCCDCKLVYFSPAIFGDGEFYSKISKNCWYYEDGKWEFDVAATFLGKVGAQSILEIGCGSGEFLKRFNFDGWDASGIDINPSAISSCQANGLKTKLATIYDVHDSYQAIVMFQVLEHIEGLENFFEYLVKNLLHPGGYLIIAVPNPDGFLGGMGENNLLDLPPHHNSGWGLDTFKYLSQRYGLEIIEYVKEPLRFVHYESILNDRIKQSSSNRPENIKQKIVMRVQSLVVRILAPLFFSADQFRIEGQTHLVIFKKNVE